MAPIRRVPAVADVQRTGGIGGHEFQQDARGGLRGVPAVVLAALENRLQLRVEGGRRQVEIDETGAGDLDLLQLVGLGDLLDDGRGQVARAAARRFCEAHRDVGREVTVRGIAGALDRALGREVARRVGEFGQAGQGVVEKFRYRGFHWAGACRLERFIGD